MRSQTSDAGVFEQNRADDPSGLQETRLQRDIPEPTESVTEVPRANSIRIEDHLNLAKKVAQTFCHLEEFDELQSICYLALIGATNKFDESLGYQFSTYAYISMRRAVIKHLKKKAKRISHVHLEGDVPCHREPEKPFDIPKGLTFNEEQIFRMRLLGYKHCEIKDRLSLSENAYQKSLARVRYTIEEKT